MKTWPDTNDVDEMIEYERWRYEVANGDTVLGFRDWLAAQKEDS